MGRDYKQPACPKADCLSRNVECISTELETVRGYTTIVRVYKCYHCTYTWKETT